MLSFEQLLFATTMIILGVVARYRRVGRHTPAFGRRGVDETLNGIRRADIQRWAHRMGVRLPTMIAA